MDKEQELDRIAQIINVCFPIVVGNTGAMPSFEQIPQLKKEHGTTKLLSGFRQALNDILGFYTELDNETILKLDRNLESEGLPTFTALYSIGNKQYRKIVRRGKIVTDDEYYLINGVLCDTPDLVSDIELSKLATMVEAYEFSA